MKKQKEKPPALLLAEAEQRIRDLGGTYQKPWPWVEGDFGLRLHQLHEYIHKLEKEKKHG